MNVWEHEHQMERELSAVGLAGARVEFSADPVEFNEPLGEEGIPTLPHASPHLHCAGSQPAMQCVCVENATVL